MMVPPHDTELTILVMVDHTVCEALFNGGRIAMVTPVPAGALYTGAAAAANGEQVMAPSLFKYLGACRRPTLRARSKSEG